MLAYEDGPGALDWLSRAFGFEIRERWLVEDGRLTHGELALGDQVVMLASGPAGYESPNTLKARYPAAAEWLSVPYVVNGVLLRIENLDQVLNSARAAGAEVLSEIEEGFPGRRCRVADFEGQRWFLLEASA